MKKKKRPFWDSWFPKEENVATAIRGWATAFLVIAMILFAASFVFFIISLILTPILDLDFEDLAGVGAICVPGSVGLVFLAYFQRLFLFSIAERSEAASLYIKQVKPPIEPTKVPAKQVKRKAEIPAQKNTVEQKRPKQATGISCPYCSATVEVTQTAKQTGYCFCPECGKSFLSNKAEAEIKKQKQQELAKREAAEKKEQEEQAKQNLLKEEKKVEEAKKAEEELKNAIPCPLCSALISISETAKQSGHGFCPECGKSFPLPKSE